MPYSLGNQSMHVVNERRHINAGFNAYILIFDSVQTVLKVARYVLRCTK